MEKKSVNELKIEKNLNTFKRCGKINYKHFVYCKNFLLKSKALK